MKMNNKTVKLFLAIATFGAALATPASASTISAVVGVGSPSTATFTNGVLTGVANWTVSMFAGYTVANTADITVSVSGGQLIFNAVSGAFNATDGVLNGLTGNFLTITLPGASALTGTGSPSLIETYGTGSGMLSAAAAADLSVGTALTNVSNTFATNACTGTCSGTTGSSVNGTYTVSSNTNFYASTLQVATPEPGSFFLLGAGMVAAGLYKRKSAAGFFARQI
jgi:hypothetical protein